MYEDSTGGLIAVAVCGTIGVLILLVLLVLALNDAQHQKESGEQMAEVMRKYDTMNTSEVTKHTINNFHTELHECFPSDKAYYDYVSAFDNDTAFEICRIDMKLLSDLTLNKDNDSLDTEPVDSSRYERYM